MEGYTQCNYRDGLHLSPFLLFS